MIDVAQAVVSGLEIGFIYALVAVGLTLIYGVMEIVNFAHGEFLTVGMYAAFVPWAVVGLDPLLSIPIAALVVAALGAATYILVIRRVLTGPAFSQVIVTFGLLVLLAGLLQVIFTANTQAVTDPLVGPVRIELLGVVAGGPQLAAAAGAGLEIVALHFLLTRTETGLAIRAVSQDVAAARVMGINPDRIRLLTWILTGGLVGSAGALLMNFFPTSPMAGASFGLVSFIVVSMAGFGSVPGALLAGVGMGLVQNIAGLVVPQLGFAAIFAVYLLVMTVRRRGLVGGR